MKACGCRTGDSSNDISGIVAYCKNNRRFFFAVLLFQFLPGRIKYVLTTFCFFFFFLLARFLFCLDLLFQIVREGGARWRIRRCEIGIALHGFFRQPERPFLYIYGRRFCRRQQHDILVQHGISYAAKRTVIIQDVKSSAKACDSKIGFPLLDCEIAYCNGRHASFHLNPPLTAVNCEEKTEFRPGKKQIGIFEIFRDRPDASAFGQVSRNGGPRFTAISTLQDVGFEVTHLIVVERGVDNISGIL